ncbi:hypothetical protein R6Q59_010112 [Mikania micrantha]
MMSNPPSSLQQRQRLHRRQQSTPVAFEAMKVQHPATVQRQNSQHRRGQSIDSRSPIRRQHQHTGSMVGITNIGSTPFGQQILREAQQQRLSRPGQQQSIELPVSPQCGIFLPQSRQSLPTSPYDNMTMNAVMQAQSMAAHSQYFSQDSHMPPSAGLQGAYEIDENNQHYFQNAHMFPHNVGAPMHERRMSQPDLRIQTGIRPLTPTQQFHSAHLPLTPAQTPFRIQQYAARPVQPSPVQHYQNEHIKAPYPVSMQKSRSLQGIVEQEELPVGSSGLSAAYEIAEMPVPSSYTSALEPVKAQSARIPMNTNIHSAPQTPKDEELSFFDETGGEQPSLDANQIPVLSQDDTDTEALSPSRPTLSPRRMSISDLNLDPGISASIEETNVTLDDIAQYIEGPDPADNKWICRFDDCNKRFGRKENIKSHVQTHLGDRQFKCNHCTKCFVRGHDLKRHAKIHTGTKPYPCLCGNAFARHDALTRHRQRGMCIGAFDGIVKKVIKRGRPRKHRPEMDDRLDKANRSRRSHHEGQDQYASSASSCSMSSWDSPPTETMDALSIHGQSPYEDVNLFANEQIAFPPDMFTFTPPTSPGYSTGNGPSPSYRELSPAEVASIAGSITNRVLDLPCTSTSIAQPIPLSDMDNLHHVNGVTANAMTIQHSQQSLPSLSHSSSSPAADIAAFDFGSDDPSMTGMHALGLNMSTLSSMSNASLTKIDLLAGQERNEFDNFLDFGGVEMGYDGSGADNFFAL